MENDVIFQLPFEGQWLTNWGGDTPEQNRHSGGCQKYAFDFVQTNKEGTFFRTDGKTNNDYFSFGITVVAPADGEVIEVVDGVRDNKSGETHNYVFPGNHLLIRHDKNTFSMLAHFKLGSIVVKAGQKIKQGDKLGLCGNSGNSSDPHIHFHVQDSDIFAKFNDTYERINVAKGKKISFEKINVSKNGKQKLLKQYSPIKDDVVSN